MTDQPDVAARVAANLRDPAAFRAFFRFYAAHPVHLIALFAPLMLQQLGSIRFEYEGLSHAANFWLLMMRFAAYFVVLLLIVPPVMRAALKRNIPYAYAFYAIFFIGSLVSALLMPLVESEAFATSPQPLRFIRQQVFSLGVIVAVLYYFQVEVQARLGVVPTLVPFWRPVRADEAKSAIRSEEAMAEAVAHPGSAKPSALDGRLIDPALAGQVRALNAQNQYVLVMTDIAQKLIRQSITTAIARLPADAGLRVHRSWWVSRAELARLKLVEGGTRLEGPGVSYPVSRSCRAEVRAALDQEAQGRSP